jgi:hypothetical protein
MNDEPGWGDLVQELEKIKATQRLSADWLAYEGSEDYGVWHLRPDDANTDESRATFGLIAAHIIAKLAIPPVPVPQPLEYCPRWKMSCNAEEESVPKSGASETGN